MFSVQLHNLQLKTASKLLGDEKGLCCLSSGLPHDLLAPDTPYQKLLHNELGGAFLHIRSFLGLIDRNGPILRISKRSGEAIDRS